MATDIQKSANDDEKLRLSANIVAAYVGQNTIAASQIPDLIHSVYSAFTALTERTIDPEPEQQKPAVSIKRSITQDYLICLEDGKQLKMLKRHLRTNYGLTPEEYRAKWGLASDYPMVAPGYAEQRSQFAKDIGLGRKKIS